MIHFPDVVPKQEGKHVDEVCAKRAYGENDDLVLPPTTVFSAVLNVADQDEGLFICAVQTAIWRVHPLPNSTQISIIIFIADIPESRDIQDPNFRSPSISRSG